MKNSWDSKLQFDILCSIRILTETRVIRKKRELFHNKEDKLITLVSREVDHPKYDEVEKGLVRVENYRSVIVITYEDFDKPGFTSMFTYHDNVSKILPSGIVFFLSERLKISIKDIYSNFSLASGLQVK